MDGTVLTEWEIIKDFVNSYSRVQRNSLLIVLKLILFGLIVWAWASR